MLLIVATLKTSTCYQHNSTCQCSNECGGGIETRSVMCMKVYTNYSRVNKYNDINCNDTLKPNAVRYCNRHDCGKPTWISTQFSAVS